MRTRRRGVRCLPIRRDRRCVGIRFDPVQYHELSALAARESKSRSLLVSEAVDLLIAKRRLASDKIWETDGA